MIKAMKVLALLLGLAAVSPAALKTLHVQERGDYAGGRAYSSAGVYERITAVGTNDGGQTVSIEMIRPRDPAKGNGTLIVTGPGRTGSLEPLLAKGFHVLRIERPESADAIRDLLTFLRYGGKPLLLSDSRQFVKRVIAHVPKGSSALYLKGFDTEYKDAKQRSVVDAQHAAGIEKLVTEGQ